MQPAVWLARLDDFRSDSKQSRLYASWLSADERARQQSFKQYQARHQFLLSRALLRSKLGEITGRSPSSLSFTITASGKPQLATVPELQFSLSHSGQWIGLATSHSAPIGLDIEHPHRPRDYLKIAHHYFHPEECALLEASPQGIIESQFYRIWTLKEAFFKARGTGIYEGLGRINFAEFTQTLCAQIDPSLEVGAPWQFYYAHNPAASNDGLHLALASQDTHIHSAKIMRVLPD